jgi:hypothetical protein
VPARLAVVAILPVLLVGSGCSGEDAPPRSGEAIASAPADSLAAHTPGELRHPCDLVPGRAASEVLGFTVEARKVRDKLAPRAMECGYGRRGGSPVAEVRSGPDPTPVDALVRLYIGTDRLRHHPVDVPHADGAAAIVDPGPAAAPAVTVFAKQGFVTHTVVVRLPDEEDAERAAVELAGLVVAGNR